jgi:hypothetical protein
MKTGTRGFIALLSVIIITLVLLVLASTLGFTGFFARSNILDSELKAESDFLALSCIEHVRLKLALDTSFAGVGQIDVGTKKCEYDASSGNIKAWAQAGNARTYYYAQVDLNESEIPIISFKECTGASACP